MAKKPKKSSPKTSKAAKTKRSPRFLKERHPECHDITGKYTFLYLFFAACTLIFALTTVYLYSVAHDIIRRYDNFVQQTQQNGNKYEGETYE